MKKLTFIVAIFVLFNAIILRADEKIKVIDGDTIHIGKLKYRFSGIDAP